MNTKTKTGKQSGTKQGKLREKGARRLKQQQAVFIIDDVNGDELSWQPLARSHGVELPPRGLPVTEEAMRYWLRILGMSVSQYLAWTREENFDVFRQQNPPEWDLRRWVGVLLEQVGEGPLGDDGDAELSSETEATEPRRLKQHRKAGSVTRVVSEQIVNSPSLTVERKAARYAALTE